MVGYMRSRVKSPRVRKDIRHDHRFDRSRARGPAPAAAGHPRRRRRLRKTFATGRTRSVEWRKQQLRALERMMTENEAADRRRAGHGPGAEAVRGLAGRHRQHRRARPATPPRTSASGCARKLPPARDVAAARPRLGRVRAVRHRAGHRRVELPVRADARARRRRHRRGQHRGAQAVGGRAGVVGG